MRASLIRLAPLGIGILSIGCGGAGGPAASSSGGNQTAKVGPVDVSYIGRPQPLISSSSGQISTFGQAGVSYSNISIDPTPSLSSTYLTFFRLNSGSGDQSYTMPSNGSGGQSLLLHTGQAAYPSCSQNGTISFFTDALNTYQIETVQNDGSQVKTVISGVPGLPAISPNGAVIVYINMLTGNIFSIPAAGGTPTQIYSGGNAQYQAVFSPTGTQIAFSAKNAATGSYNVYTMNVAGGAATNVTPSFYQPGNTYVSSWSPDGTTLAGSYTAKNGTQSSILTITLNGSFNSTLTPAAYDDYTPSFSPDGSKIAFYRNNAGGAIPGIYICDFAGSSPQLILQDPPSTGTTGGVQGLRWSPFQQLQKFVGVGGTLSTANASGFLMSQSGNQFASLLTFAATTPSKATISSPPVSTTGASTLYTLGADAITNISYTNSYNGAHVSLPLTPTPVAIVSIDGSTGQVEMVAAASVLKEDMSQSRGGAGVATYSGKFTAIYDGSGKNSAPLGATSLQINRATGKLISFR